MDADVTFLGAAGNVTGSCTLVRVGNTQVLVDCGLYQERDLQERNWSKIPVPLDSIDAVLLTHAHLDHCGRLPKLIRDDGFRGRILGTPATLEIARILLYDSAHLQEEDVRKKEKRHQKEGRVSPYPYEPLYARRHVDLTVERFEAVPYEIPVQIANGVTARFFEAGHIFGSTMIELELKVNNERRIVVFSGDVGRKNLPIINDPHRFETADVVVVESTYGDRTHGEVKNIPTELERVIVDTQKRGGNIVIPGFAVERTQEILYHMTGLLQNKRILPVLTFVDSPMAIGVTEVFRKHPELFDAEMVELMNRGQSPYDFPGLTLCRTAQQSKAINSIRGTAIIVAGSGMCTGGRIKHHLFYNLPRRESTILFVGYQARGTLGRQILDGASEVRIFGERVPVKAKIEKISGFSGHADRNELLEWLSAFQNQPRVIINHGEHEAAIAFSQVVTERGLTCELAEYQKIIQI